MKCVHYFKGDTPREVVSNSTMWEDASLILGDKTQKKIQNPGDQASIFAGKLKVHIDWGLDQLLVEETKDRFWIQLETSYEQTKALQKDEKALANKRSSKTRESTKSKEGIDSNSILFLTLRSQNFTFS